MWRRFCGRCGWPIGLPGFAGPETTRACKVLVVVAGAQSAVRHRLARARRMDETTASCIDTHMIDMSTVDTEENQVARR